MPRTIPPHPYPATPSVLPARNEAELKKMKEVNAQLKAKILEFKKQTEENVEGAKREIGKLALKAQAVEANNKSVMEQLEQIKQKMEGVTKELCEKNADQRFGEIAVEVMKRKADEYRLYTVARNTFRLLRESARLTKIEKQIALIRNQHTTHLAFQIMKQAQLIRALMKQKKLPLF